MSSVARALRTSLRARAPLSARAGQASSARAALGRRTMSSSAHGHGASGGSDTVWMIGSAVVFGPALVYLLSPASRKPAHKVAEAHEPHHVTTQQETKEEPPMKDDEGTEVSGEEIKDSMSKAFDSDSPKDAQDAEEEQKGESSGAEEKAEEGEQKEEKKDEGAEVKGKEGEKKDDKAEDKEEDKVPEVHEPTNMGEARLQAKSGVQPKEADPKTES
ncbi:hypothetical protein CONPUDRAFT_164057 [Coniophora puteana RWD-64-598 SS2]|uniref:Uncharacterized protein n=1 Tax=Coniophora puteana (strain RWD-64-598) TaxID=741705 RepID=A0A5M3MWG4_CONPW|nr:uncharacterized protein CONPUDRAFT_164057 [Coniophora puteana RWD-64-598 SS2]EIW83045.1 hypothetical protein CONPUDRAFT_164057 [Coniophora puteana RWD-64-598 SS2]